MCAMCPCPCWNGDMLLSGSGPPFSRSPGFVSSHYFEVLSRWDTKPSEKPGGGGAGRAGEPFNPCQAKAEITEIEALQRHHSTWKNYTDIKKGALHTESQRSIGKDGSCCWVCGFEAAKIHSQTYQSSVFGQAHIAMVILVKRLTFGPC